MLPDFSALRTCVNITGDKFMNTIIITRFGQTKAFLGWHCHFWLKQGVALEEPIDRQ